METTISKKNLNKEIRTAVKGLKPNHRKVMIARLQGKKLSEIGNKMKLTPARVGQLDQVAWLKVIEAISAK